MTKIYSIAEARQDFAAIVKELEQQPVIQITRRGQLVAVLVSSDEFSRLSTKRTGFWEAYESFREQVDLASQNLEPSIFESLRQEDTGREVGL